MFNFSGSEIIFLLILGLVVLGPEKLPPVLRKMGQMYGQFKKITGDAQSEFRGAFAEPLRDMQNATNEYKTVFTDASKLVDKQVIDTTAVFTKSAAQEQQESVVEPLFIPYESDQSPSAPSELDLEPTIIEYEIKEDK
ncbi:MAG: twin-arginine translocase TatA/TatE family subunit [Ilumatobacteraceae bacterium]|nr:twin-arginine translocase TatA/TatE family subunit [Ilumatobacteraceae bacterium]